jgi:hypothetical protein
MVDLVSNQQLERSASARKVLRENFVKTVHHSIVLMELFVVRWKKILKRKKKKIAIKMSARNGSLFALALLVTLVIVVNAQNATTIVFRYL